MFYVWNINITDTGKEDNRIILLYVIMYDVSSVSKVVKLILSQVLEYEEKHQLII